MRPSLVLYATFDNEGSETSAYAGKVFTYNQIRSFFSQYFPNVVSDKAQLADGNTYGSSTAKNLVSSILLYEFQHESEHFLQQIVKDNLTLPEFVSTVFNKVLTARDRGRILASSTKEEQLKYLLDNLDKFPYFEESYTILQNHKNELGSIYDRVDFYSITQWDRLADEINTRMRHYEEQFKENREVFMTKHELLGRVKADILSKLNTTSKELLDVNNAIRALKKQDEKIPVSLKIKASRLADREQFLKLFFQQNRTTSRIMFDDIIAEMFPKFVFREFLSAEDLP